MMSMTEAGMPDMNQQFQFETADEYRAAAQELAQGFAYIRMGMAAEKRLRTDESFASFVEAQGTLPSVESIERRSPWLAAALDEYEAEQTDIVDTALADEVVASYINSLKKTGRDFDSLPLSSKVELIQALPELDEFQLHKEGFNRIIGPLRAKRDEPKPDPVAKTLPPIGSGRDWSYKDEASAPREPKVYRNMPPIRKFNKDGSYVEVPLVIYPRNVEDDIFDGVMMAAGKVINLAEKGVQNIKDIDHRKFIGAAAASAILASTVAGAVPHESSRERQPTILTVAVAQHAEMVKAMEAVKPEILKQPTHVEAHPEAEPVAHYISQVVALKTESLSHGQPTAVQQALKAQAAAAQMVIDHPEVADVFAKQGIAEPENDAQQAFVDTALAGMAASTEYTTDQQKVIFGLLARAQDLATPNVDPVAPVESAEPSAPATATPEVVTPTEPATPETVAPTAPETTAPAPESAAPRAESALDIEHYKGDILSKVVLERLQQNFAVYEQVAHEENVPWALLAAVHIREHGAVAENPGNGQGIYQFFDQHGGPYPEGPVSHEEFVRQTRLMAQFLKDKAKNHNNDELSNLTENPDPEVVKDTLFSYNGRSEKYIEQAHRLGFKYGRDGSPYVMNLADDLRNPDKNPDGWGQVKHDRGPVEFAANKDAGGFVLYRELMALAGTPIADSPGVKLDPAERAALLEQENRAKQLATAILNNPHIRIDESPNERVRKSIEDIRDDGKTFLYDVDQNNKHEIRISDDVLAAVIKLAESGQEFTITSLTTSHSHSKSSDHYKGTAIDVTGDYQAIFKFLYENREALHIDELIYGGDLPAGMTTLKHGEAGSYSDEVLQAHVGHLHFSTKQ